MRRSARLAAKAERKRAASRGRVAAAAGEGASLVAHQQRVFALTYFLYVVMYFGRKNFDSVKKSMGAELALTDLELGHIDTAFLVAYAAGQFSVGPFGDKYGARKMLAVSLIGGAVGCAWMSTVATLRDAVLAWGVNGFFQAMGFPLVMKALAPWFTSEQRGTVLGFWTTSQQVGGTLATTFSGFVAAGGITSASLIFHSSASAAALSARWRAV